MELIVGRKYKIKSLEEILEMYPDYYGIPHGWAQRMDRCLGDIVEIVEHQAYKTHHGVVMSYKEYTWHHTLLEEVPEVTRTQRLLKFARESYGVLNKVS